ncbi:MAG TPA: pullulanase-type alpha-1,6-glucosidase [Herpetosiphonaceae bacterium]
MFIHRWKRAALLLPLVALLASVLPYQTPAVQASHPPDPTSVTIAGSLQEELGCPGDWQPECATTHLTYDAADTVWQRSFTVPAGDYEYKAALNNSWTENYGLNASPGGANIPLSVPASGAVKFYYSHATHWVTSNRNAVIATAAGSFQSELGCPADWSPDCLRSWLQDPDGDGTYTFLTTALPAGNYAVKVAINESWDENYGANGVPGGPNIDFTVPEDNAEIFFSYNAVTHILTISAEGAPKGNLGLAKAHWVDADTIAWQVPGGEDNTYTLHFDPEGDLMLTPDGVTGGDSIDLVYDPAGLSAAVLAKFPHLAGYSALKLDLDEYNDPDIRQVLKGQIAVSATDGDGDLIDATSLQIPGVLDDLYTYDGELGIVYDGNVPALKLWAPTARSVKLHVFADSDPDTTSTVYPMSGDELTGVWSIEGDASWTNKFYLFEVEVFARTTGQVEHNIVTDPYSLSLSTNSARSQIVNLADPALKPAGWDETLKPDLKAPEDIVLYELHVRDFSASDPKVPAEHRGTFKAFTDTGSNGMQHLRALARAGLTHIHLLPVFDIATINENKAEREDPDPALLATYPADSEEQARIVEEYAERDSFNWGYDPFHYTTPEGSYSTNPDGSTRIVEFREMVQSLNQSGLRVVMDVVYNHTNASGQDEKSVLDKVVPGYYHRLNASGNVENSTCCQNTATEHNMMEKLMVDSVVTWAKYYKVDGFRFDLMGHHMKDDMIKVRDALHALTPANDGVDGSKIYVYGEGWDFGEVAQNARGINATQLNMPGTGIGTFNDRLRDAARGGGPFDVGPDLKKQGFINGLYYDPNDLDQGDPAAQRSRLLLNQDQIRVGLAGNLRDYLFTDRTGAQVKGSEVDYNGSPTGYTLDPQEVINYVEAHDNQTLFDIVQTKAPADATIAERVRMHNLGMDLVALTQGVPFFQAGQDMLRSKSLDRNSYNSGDWFNRLDFTYETNNWGVGLPPGENEANWPVLKPLLANPALKPSKANILDAVEHFRELLRMRKSSPLFRLQTAEQIQQQVRFLNTGPDQQAGLIVMSIGDNGATDLDDEVEQIVVLFNANDEAQSFTQASLSGQQLWLHPEQATSSDPIVRSASYDKATGTFTIPARTTAVFVLQEKFTVRMPIMSKPANP